MEIQIQEKKACQNCKFYQQHYTKCKRGFGAIYCGICMHKYNKKRTPDFVCEYWEDSVVKEQERQDSIKKALFEISKKLNDIADVLNDDFYKLQQK